MKLMILMILVFVMFVIIANAESLTESEALANQKGAHYLSGCRRHTHEHTHIHSIH